MKSAQQFLKINHQCRYIKYHNFFSTVQSVQGETIGGERGKTDPRSSTIRHSPPVLHQENKIGRSICVIDKNVYIQSIIILITCEWIFNMKYCTAYEELIFHHFFIEQLFAPVNCKICSTLNSHVCVTSEYHLSTRIPATSSIQPFLVLGLRK